jgi:hypothetical protein
MALANAGATRQGLRGEFRPGSPSASLAPGNRFEGVWVMPGKIAGAHRHSATALRLMIEGRGGDTVVNGKRTSQRDPAGMDRGNELREVFGGDGTGPGFCRRRSGESDDGFARRFYERLLSKWLGCGIASKSAMSPQPAGSTAKARPWAGRPEIGIASVAAARLVGRRRHLRFTSVGRQDLHVTGHWR